MTTLASSPRRFHRYPGTVGAYVAVCLLCLALLIPVAASTGSSTTVGLAFSLSANHSDAVGLDGEVSGEQIYVFAYADGATSVRFWLDRPVTQTPTQTESSAPFDLMGGTSTVARPLSLTKLAPGAHTVIAIATFPNALKTRADATFEVPAEQVPEDEEPSSSDGGSGTDGGSSGDGDGTPGGDGSGTDGATDGGDTGVEPIAEPGICDRTDLPAPLSSFPGPGNTGVPPETDLRVVEGDFHTHTDGQVVSRLDISGRLSIDHDNVTVTCTRVHRMTTNNGVGLRMWSSTLGDAHGVREGSALKWRDYTLRRVDIFGTFDGLKAEGNVDVRDSYIHDLYRTSDNTQPNGMTHNDAVQIGQGSGMTFVNNTFYTWSFTDGETAGTHLLKTSYGDGSGYMTSAFMITNGLGPVRDVVIKGNLIRGRASKYIFVLRDATGVDVIDNTFGRDNRDYPKLLAVNSATSIVGNTVLPAD
jgi:hypothetical protein